MRHQGVIFAAACDETTRVLAPVTFGEFAGGPFCTVSNFIQLGECRQLMIFALLRGAIRS
jgi:hypothetical protein